MKAAFLVGAEKLELRDIPDPVTPDDGLVLNVRACGVCGSDLRRWREGLPEGSGDLISGHEAAGVVMDVGRSVTDYAPGDRLAIAPDVHCGKCYYCVRGMFNLCDNPEYIGITPGYPGGFADRLALTHRMLANGIVHRMPDGMSYTTAALAEPCSSVLAAHQKAATGLGDTVVVMGAGPIGCLHTLVSKARGASVIVSEPRDIRREMVQRFRPDAIIDPFSQDLNACVRDLTSGLGADLVICANPVAATQDQAVRIVRKAGRVVLFGGLPRTDPTTCLDGNRIHYGEIEVVGAYSYHPSMHKLALELLALGVIPADLLITHIMSLDRICEAFETAAGGAALKVMVTP